MQARRPQAGGKGVNVSRVLAGLGLPVRSVVVVGGETGDSVREDLERARLAPIVVRATGESRVCLEVIEQATGVATQLHGVGVEASESTASELVRAVDRAIDGCAWMAVCGSLPRGCPTDVLARLIEVARARGVPVAIDTSGPGLAAVLREEIDLLRINREEATGLEASDVHDLRHAARSRAGVVSDGGGTLLAWARGEGEWTVTPPRVAATNAIGCGDAMLAGLLARIDAESFEDALRYATALASASAESAIVECPPSRRVRELLERVAVKRIADASVT